MVRVAAEPAIADVVATLTKLVPVLTAFVTSTEPVGVCFTSFDAPSVVS